MPKLRSLLFLVLFHSYSVTAAPTGLECTQSNSNLDDIQKALSAAEEETCPAPTKQQLKELCYAAAFPTDDTSADGIGRTYHKILWQMSCATPKVDSTSIGREKVRKMWAKHRENLRCEVTGLGRSEDLNIAKYAIDSTNTRFAQELAIAYKVDFNFVDAKDKMTLLDFVQEKLKYQRSLVPPSEVIIGDYEHLYNAIVRNGGKHSKDL